MNIVVDENSTRNSIILLLKKNGGMSIDELSKSVDITPMGIRQHLLALEKKDVVTYTVRKRGIGRPGFIYMLTEAANELFPKTYDEFALGILRDITRYEGPDKIDQIFGWRRDRMLELKKEALAGGESVEETLNRFRQLLEADGHLVDLSRNNGHYHLKQYHCPIGKVAREFGDVCKHELRLYRELFGKNVIREQSVSEGAPACLYVIPAV
ncbi:MAG: transcriptional regulator [Candidatus Sulfobium sp.]|jgi:predicted ArsR family transcriptional regulator